MTVYILSKLFDVLATPSALLLFLSTVGLLMTLRRKRWANRFLATGIGGLLTIAILPVGTWIMRPLEDRFPMPHPMPDRVDGVILLGGAISVDRSLDRGEPILNDAAGRMTAFVALAHRYPRARLVFSGGNPDPFAKKPTEAGIARRFFGEMGLGQREIVYESQSRNTHENALYSYRLAKPRQGETWLLVTSAADLPRAVGCFRAAGWQVTAMPADYHTLHKHSGLTPGLVSGLRTTDWAVHEWIGLVYYWLRGWTPLLLPGPA